MNSVVLAEMTLPVRGLAMLPQRGRVRGLHSPLLGWFVSPTGSASNSGSIGSPWSLSHALSGAGGVIVAGDTIWMRGGTYTQGASWVCSTSGAMGSGIDAQDSKIKWRNQPGELVSITTTNTDDDTLDITGSFNWWWGSVGQAEGIEVWRNVTERFDNRGSNIWMRCDVNQDGNKLLHLITRDGSNGIYAASGNAGSFKTGDLEIYGVLSYNNGQDHLTTGPRTHAVYLRHEQYLGTRDLLQVYGCIAFNQVGNGLQFYAGNVLTDGMKGVRAILNIVFGAGVLGTAGEGTQRNLILSGSTSSSPLEDCEATDNVLYHTGTDLDMGQVLLGSTAVVNRSAIVSRNTVVGGATSVAKFQIQEFDGVGFAGLDFHDNRIIPRAASLVVEVVTAGNQSANISTSDNVYYRDATATGWRHGSNKTFANWKTDTGLGATDTAVTPDPTVTEVTVIPLTKYTPKYGHVAFFNWGSLSVVPVDLSTILTVGDSYKVWNAQDRFGAPVLSGTYAGGTVNFPTTGVTPPTPVGTTPRTASTTAPFFDAFVVLGA